MKHFSGLLTSTDAKGKSTTNYYAPDTGQLLWTTDATGHGTTNSYDGNELLASSVDSLGTTTYNTYDPLTDYLLGTGTEDANGAILSSNSFTYDDNGNRLTSTVWRRVGGAWTPATTTYVLRAKFLLSQALGSHLNFERLRGERTLIEVLAVDGAGRIDLFRRQLAPQLAASFCRQYQLDPAQQDANASAITKHSMAVVLRALDVSN